MTAILPYDVINKILEYVAHLNDSRSRMLIDNQGRISFHFNIWFSEFSAIHDINLYKQSVQARQVKLRIRVWPNTQHEFVFEVDAIEEPRRICDKVKSDYYFALGQKLVSKCYTYFDPTGYKCYAYVNSKYSTTNNRQRHTGEIRFDGVNDSYPVVGFHCGSSEVALLTINPVSTLMWEIDTEGDIEAAMALLELEEGEIAEDEELNEFEDEEYYDEVDFNNLPPLQIYT